MISVSVFLFPPESSLSYIRMVVVPMGRCRLFVVVLLPPIVLMRVGNIPVSQWSIHLTPGYLTDARHEISYPAILKFQSGSLILYQPHIFRGELEA